MVNPEGAIVEFSRARRECGSVMKCAILDHQHLKGECPKSQTGYHEFIHKVRGPTWWCAWCCEVYGDCPCEEPPEPPLRFKPLEEMVG
jgi:hypothetical protein